MKNSKSLKVIIFLVAMVLIWVLYPKGQKPLNKSGDTERLILAARTTEVAKSADQNDSNTANQVTVRQDNNEPNKPAAGNTDANDSNSPSKISPNEPNRPSDSNQPQRSRSRRSRSGGDENGFRRSSSGETLSESQNAADPNDPLVALNLKDVEMSNIIQKLSEWTGKVIIPNDEVMKQKITIYAPQRLPRSKALNHIYAALRVKGFVAEQDDGTIYLKPIKDAVLGNVPTIKADQPLASVENKNQIVQKFFELKNYTPSKMAGVIKPLIGEHGFVSADDSSSSLLVIDTVDNLMRFEKIIDQFDVSESEQTVERIFEIKYADPAEVVQVLRKLMGIEEKNSTGLRTNGRNVSFKQGQNWHGQQDQSQNESRPNMPNMPNQDQNQKKDGAKGEAKSVLVNQSQIPITLIPEPNRKWIVASASAGDMKLIEGWIEKLDTQKEVTADSETLPVTYADVDEVAEQINDALQQMPGSELKTSVLIQPLSQSRQIIIFGRKEIRDIVKNMIMEIDIPSNMFETKVFDLKNADPDTVKVNIEGLYETQSGNFGSYRSGRYSSRDVSPKDTVKVISYPTMHQVTVIGSPENLKKIEAQIKEWDVPLSVDDVKPRIIEVHNSDPVQMATLLTTLFSEETSSGSSRPWWMFDEGGEDSSKKKIVGALYGQLTFEAVPDTKKIVVISKIPAAYKVVEELIQELDHMEVAELPMVVTLNYADAEDLCDQLNAILNEPGTVATIRRSQRGLSSYTPSASTASSNSSDSSSESTSTDIIQPWWNRGGNTDTVDQMPISNLLGRIRVIPVHRSKAILVMSPKEYQQSLKEMITQLDQPGRQVMVKAVIVQVDHDQRVTLGTKFSSDPSSFGDVGQNAVTALTSLEFLDKHGAVKLPDKSGSSASSAGDGTLVSSNISVIIDLLQQRANGKILNEPTLWTKDNEEATFFKGRNVAFISNAQTSQEGTATTRDYQYQDIGVTLRIRPNITPEKNVDLTINLGISEIEPVLINTQVATSKLDTTTNLIVQDGQTIMMGGILFQNENQIDTKVPFLGDIPLVGNLFRHQDKGVTNNELMIFITPFVIDDKVTEEALKELEQAQHKLENVLTDLNNDVNDSMKKKF